MSKKFEIKNCLGGFTLIELLVFVAILGIIGSIVLSVLFTTFRVSKKADTLVELRQSGNAVISQVAKNIRYAKNLDYPNTCVGGVNVNYITITSTIDNAQTKFSCDDFSSGQVITANGSPLIDTDKTIITQCLFTCSQEALDSPPTIQIKFRMHLLHEASLAENQTSIPFNTSVTLRNYNK